MRWAERASKCASHTSGSIASTKPPGPARAAALKLNKPTLAPMSQTTEPGLTSSQTMRKSIGSAVFHTPSPTAQAGFRRNIQRQALELLWQMPAQNHTPPEPLCQVAQIREHCSNKWRRAAGGSHRLARER